MAGRSLDELGDTMTWRDFQVLTRRWTVTPGFALCEAVSGVVHWSVTDQLLGEVLDAVHTGNWIAAGNKNSPRPKRFKRPWETSEVKKFGAEAIPINEFDSWWESAK